MNKNLRLYLPLFLLLCGCSTTQVRMDHEPYVGETFHNPIISIGQFSDHREHGANWLGAIRGGFGNPLKTLETPEPVKYVVRDAFENALKQRGLYSDFDDAKYVMNVDVIQYDCNQYVRKEAHIKLDVQMVDRVTNHEVYSDFVAVDNVEGSAISVQTGIFGSVEDLETLAEKTLAEAINDVFSNPALQRLYTKGV